MRFTGSLISYSICRTRFDVFLFLILVFPLATAATRAQSLTPPRASVLRESCLPDASCEGFGKGLGRRSGCLFGATQGMKNSCKIKLLDHHSPRQSGFTPHFPRWRGSKRSHMPLSGPISRPVSVESARLHSLLLGDSAVEANRWSFSTHALSLLMPYIGSLTSPSGIAATLLHRESVGQRNKVSTIHSAFGCLKVSTTSLFSTRLL